MLGVITPVPHLEPKEFDQVFAINVTANYRLIRSLDLLLRQSEAGRAVFVSSSSARSARAFWGLYAATKAALEALIKSYAAEVANTPLKVNVFYPGAVRTAMRAKAVPGEDPETLPPPEVVAPKLVDMVAPAFTETRMLFDYRDGRAASRSRRLADPRHQHLVDAAAVDVEHLEPPRRALERLADLRQVAAPRARSRRRSRTSRPSGSARRSCRRTRRPASSRRRVAAVLAHDEGGLVALLLAGTMPVIASRMSPEVTMPSKCPYSSKTSAMCTVDERMARSTCSASERSITTGACRIMRADIERLAVGEKVDEVLEDEHADDLVGIAVLHRQPRAVRAADDPAGSPRAVVGEVDELDIAPRRHQAARRTVGEAHDARDHRAFLALEHAGALGLGDDGLDLFVGHPLLGLAGLAEQRAARAGPRHRAARPAARRPWR